MANETEKLIKIGKKISYYRNLKNLSQNQLAEKLNISREHLAKLETAKRRISLKLLFKLVDILEIKEIDIFNFD